MKTILPLIIFVGISFSLMAVAQEEPGSEPPASITDVSTLPTVPSNTAWKVPSEDIVSEKTHFEGDSKITVREIQPILLPDVSEQAVPNIINEELQERIEEYQEKNTHQRLLGIGAMVYRLENNQTRSLVQVIGLEGKASVSFWSSGDFSLFSGIGEIKDNQGNSLVLLMARSVHEGIVTEKELLEISGENKEKSLLGLNSNEASYNILDENPDEDLRLAINSLHEVLIRDKEKLQTYQEDRQRAAIAREEYFKANPPPAKSLTLNYWRIQKASPTNEEGGEK